MSEETTAPEGSDTAVVVDEVAEAMPEGAGSRNPTPNKYRQEIDAVLGAYEKRQARLARERAEAKAAEPPPEPQGLLDGESWDSVYGAQPPEVQRAMAEGRRAFTRKTQELSAERRKIEAQNKAVMASGLMDSLSADAGRAPEDFDPFNAEHIQQLIEAKVAARLQSVLEPLHQESKRHEAAARYQGFKEKHPDLVENADIKKGVYSALQADPSLKLEAAYWMVKGRMLSEAKDDQAARALVRRRAVKQAALITDKGRRPGRQVLSPDLKDKSAFEIYQALKSQRG